MAKPAEFEEVPGLEAEDPYPRRYERHVKWEDLEDYDLEHRTRNRNERILTPAYPLDGLIQLGISSSLDGSSHNWVSCYDEKGNPLYQILFRYPDYTLGEGHPNYRPKDECDKTATWIFRQTVEGGRLRIAELNQLGARHEMDRLERYLKGFIGEKVYQSYYMGGEVYDPVDWLDDEPDDPFEPVDPFAPASPPEKLSKAEEQRRAKLVVEAFNHSLSAQLARMIRRFRNLDMYGKTYF